VLIPFTNMNMICTICVGAKYNRIPLLAVYAGKLEILDTVHKT
jgi:hypothetical protein